jgi:hypothetical protein
MCSGQWMFAEHVTPLGTQKLPSKHSNPDGQFGHWVISIKHVFSIHTQFSDDDVQIFSSVHLPFMQYWPGQ